MIYLVRFSEIFLKGKNRKDFDRKLIANIKNFEKDIIKTQKLRERYIVHSKKKLDLKKVFGISSYSEAIETDDIKKTLKKELTNKKFRTFRVSAKRIDKKFKKSSIELNTEIGRFAVDNFKKKVSLKDFDLDIGIEIIDNKKYVFFETVQGFSGLPVGIEGNVYALIEDDKSILAALMMMKRGCAIKPIAFKKIDINKLQEYSPNKLELKVPGKMDLKNEILVSGETFKEFKEDKNNLVLRPLIAFNEEQIKEELKNY